MRQVVIGTFENVEEADAAVDRLLADGYTRDDVSVIMNKEHGSRFVRDDAPSSDTVIRDAASGGLIGGTLGAIIAASLAATGAIGAAIITGGAAAPFIAGPLAAALAGGGAGAAAGGIIGGLTGLGMSQEDSQQVEREVGQGRIVVTVRADRAHAGVADPDDDLTVPPPHLTRA